MNKTSIASNALKLTTSKIITMTISMITAMLLSRFRTLEEYGTYSQLLLIINIVTTIFMLGLPNSINFFLVRAETYDERQKFLSVYYSLSTALSFFTGFILVLSTQLIVDYFNNPIINNFMYFLALFPWTRIILSSIDNVFVVYQKTYYLMTFRILNSLALMLIVIIVRILNLGFETYMILFVGIESVFSLSVYLIVKNVSGKLCFSLDRNLIIKILKFSLPLGLASIVGTLSIELDKLLIGKFFSTEQLAIYTNAAREMPVIIVSSSITSVLMPQLVRLLKNNKNNEAITLWGDATSLSYVFICFIATGLFVYAPEVMSLLYSDKYLQGVSVFRVYNIVLLLRCTYFGIILNSIGKTKLIFYSSIASLLLNVILNYAFYLIFGFVGPSIATFVSITIIQIFQLVATSKSISLPFAKLFPWKDLSTITIINVFMGVLFYLIKVFISLEMHTGQIIESILLGGAWGIIYLFSMFKFIKLKWTSLNRSN